MTTRKLLLTLTALSLLMLAVGCSNKNLEPDLAAETPNLNSEFGGYTVANESPGLGDDELLTTAYASDDEYGDPMLSDAATTGLTADPQAGLYHMRILWGQLRFDSTVTNPTDWSGSLSITRGAEIIRRVIRFEPGQDYIVPRTDRRLIEWVSQTTVHNDGIAVDLFVPPIRPQLDTVEIINVDSLGDTLVEIRIDTLWPNVDPVVVDFKTGPYSATFNLEELTSLDTIVYVADSNAVAFHAFRLDRFPCPRGFLAGHWGFDPDGNGLFRGVWMTHRGHVVGFLKGHFGKNDNDEQVFFGKWVARDGRFEGFIRGHWGFHDSVPLDVNRPVLAGGWFRGLIFNADRQEIGVMGGQFRSGRIDESTRPRGFFQGRWKLYCPGESVTARNNAEGF